MIRRWLFLSLLPLLVPRFVHAQIEQSITGDVDHFGPGFTALSEGQVNFQLLRPANVALFWVTPDGRLDLFFPVRSRDKTLKRAGSNSISVSDIPSPIESPVISGAPVSGRAGQFTPAGSLLTGAPPKDDSTHISGYWVLLTVDAPLSAVEIQNRLQPMSRAGGGLAIIDRLAPVLVPQGTLWAQYVAAVVLR
jgi:hypothetical protein